MYKKQIDYDTVLIDYAQGTYHHAQKDYDKVISLYQKLLHNHPELTKIRFKLAQWLFEDKQFKQAEYHFDNLAKEKLPDMIRSRIDYYQQALKERQFWNIDLGLSYGHDNNINHASASSYIALGKLKFNKKAKSLLGYRYTL